MIRANVFPSLVFLLILISCHKSTNTVLPLTDYHRQSLQANLRISPGAQTDYRSGIQSLSFLSARGMEIVNAEGFTVQLRGVNLGSWLYHETWMSAVDYNLHGRLNILGDQNGLGQEVRDTLATIGPYDGESSEDAYLAQFETELSTRVDAQMAASIVDQSVQYPRIYDDSDKPLLSTLEQIYGLEGRDEILESFTDSWIDESDIQFIASMGMNVVRIPMGYRMLMNASEAEPLESPASFKESTFERIDHLLDWCEAHGLYVVLDLQEAPGGQNTYSGESTLFTDPAMQELTMALWQEISRRYRERSIVAAYSLLAEPYGAPDVQTMLAMYDRLYDGIREQNDSHLLVIHDGFFGMEKLPAPQRLNWQNVIYSTHLFEWGVDTYPAYRALIKATEAVFSKIQKRQNVPYYIGSFSTMADADYAYRALEDYLDSFDHQGWSWSLWSYKRVDDPLERDLYNTSTSWGIWSDIRSDSNWVRANVYLDTKETLMTHLEAYRTAEMELNPQLYEILSIHLTSK